MIAQARKFLAFNEPDLGEEEMSLVMDVIRSGWIGTGKVSHQFEDEFCKFMGGGYAVAVNSCTMGLQLALKCLPEKGEVITSPLTFAATLNAILNSGFAPVLVDVDHRGCLDIEKVNKKIDALTKAVIPVHYSGTPIDFSKLCGDVEVIEDCAHAFGARFSHISGDFKVFSFYPNKNITSGEGGMVWTLDKALADKVRVFASQGLSQGAWARFGDAIPTRYAVEEVGMKGNMPDILAAIGLTQLRRWPEFIEKRLKVWDIYQEAFGQMHPGHSTHFYPLRVKNRQELRLKLHSNGYGTGIHYQPLHLEPAYKFLGYQKGDFPNAESWGEEELSLPVTPKMTEDDALRIVKLVQGETYV